MLLSPLLPRLQTFTADMSLTHMWNDWRLKYNDSTAGGCLPDEFSLPASALDALWHPEIDLSNKAGEESWKI